ncbi:hypothetical protein WJX72_008112 [[Myrmecia] bisecta]|uniref:Uncharacterized protein n=1 Tax=[Myrmecia] bisecta TaxID=41462 RepID=A0AAW1QSC2_9CHLO
MQTGRGCPFLLELLSRRAVMSPPTPLATPAMHSRRPPPAPSSLSSQVATQPTSPDGSTGAAPANSCPLEHQVQPQSNPKSQKPAEARPPMSTPIPLAGAASEQPNPRTLLSQAVC